MFPLHKPLMKIIDQAMQDQAPAMHARLKKSGLLQADLQERATVATESYLEAVGQEPWEDLMARQKLPHLEQIGEMQRKERTAAEIALAQATEFPSESDQDSTTEQPLEV
jgi:hypothetical protein